MEPSQTPLPGIWQPSVVGLLTGLLALVVLEGKRGHECQRFPSLALDPLQHHPGTSTAFDNPIYRDKLLPYPLLAWRLGQPGLILLPLSLVNLACIGCAGGLVARWAELQQRSCEWGLAVLALPDCWITLPLLAWKAWLRRRFAAKADGTLASLHFTWPFAELLRKAGLLLGLAPLPGVELGGLERLLDELCFVLWLGTSTQILARFPGCKRVWIDLASLDLLMLLGGRSRDLVPWLQVSAAVSCDYALDYELMAP